MSASANRRAVNPVAPLCSTASSPKGRVGTRDSKSSGGRRGRPPAASISDWAIVHSSPSSPSSASEPGREIVTRCDAGAASFAPQRMIG
jgi:hypothetical protein